jgi:hypothetical protein
MQYLKFDDNVLRHATRGLYSRFAIEFLDSSEHQLPQSTQTSLSQPVQHHDFVALKTAPIDTHASLCLQYLQASLTGPWWYLIVFLSKPSFSIWLSSVARHAAADSEASHALFESPNAVPMAYSWSRELR